MTMLVADTSNPAVVWGVHGSPGETYWKAFVTRPDLSSPVEASEWACLPPCGISGEHRHSRTEEIYIILSGTGEFVLNGERVPVSRGSIGLTTLGNTHGLINTGSSDLEWWVIETIPPSTEGVLMSGRDHGLDPAASPAVVHQLAENSAFDMTDVFSGPLQKIERRQIGRGDDLWLGSSEVETFVYVTHGSVKVSERSGATTTAVGGSSVMFQGGGDAHLVGVEAAEVYIVSLAIPRRGGL
jgi:mannose-6-phosphate isomerase-like protein (cupin superfamily)